MAKRKKRKLKPGDADCTRTSSDLSRPLSIQWISEELMAQTVEVWSEAYGRPITRDEAIEILTNVRRLGLVLLKARTEMDAREREEARRSETEPFSNGDGR